MPLLDAAVDGEGTAFLGHRDRGTIGGEGELLVHFGGEGVALVGTVPDVEGGEHIALGGDAEAGAAALGGLLADLEPEFLFDALHAFAFGVAVDLGEYLVDFLKFQVDDVVHQALGILNMFPEKGHVEVCLVREWIFNIAVQVNGNETAAVIRTERNLTTGIG